MIDSSYPTALTASCTCFVPSTLLEETSSITYHHLHILTLNVNHFHTHMSLFKLRLKIDRFKQFFPPHPHLPTRGWAGGEDESH